MTLYQFKQEDINALWTLIAGSNLTITANNAARVAELQRLLEAATPSTELEECRARCLELERQASECLRVRDNALIEAGVAKRRADELEALCSELQDAAREVLDVEPHLEQRNATADYMRDSTPPTPSTPLTV